MHSRLVAEPLAAAKLGVLPVYQSITVSRRG